MPGGVEPEDDDDHPADHPERPLVLLQQRADERRRRAEGHEDRGEAQHEGEAGEDDPPDEVARGAPLLELRDVHPADERQVAGDDRQDAGGDEGHEAGQEGGGEGHGRCHRGNLSGARAVAGIIRGPPWCRPRACGLLGGRPRTPTMRLPDPRPRRPARAALLGLLLCALLARGQRAPRGARRRTRPPSSRASRRAWQTRDLAGWLALWDFASAGAEGARGGDRPGRLLVGRDRAELPPAAEPRPRGRRGSTPTSRSSPRPSRGRRSPTGGSRWRGARGAGRSWAGRRRARSTASSTSRSARRPGARAACRSGSRTSSCGWRTGRSSRPPTTLGPTAFAFVGRGAGPLLARARPPSASSCASSSGEPALDREVGWAFIRLHPADFHRALETGELVPETDPGPRRAEAERVWRERSQRSFTIDAPLPRSPWWLMPSPGDAVVDFPVGPQAGADLRALRGRARGREPVRPRPAPADLHLPVGGPGPAVQRGRPPRGRRAGQRHHGPLRPRPARGARHAHACACGCCRRPARCACGSTTTSGSPRSPPRTAAACSSSACATRATSSSRSARSARREEPFTLTTRYSGRHDPAPVDQELVQVAGARRRPTREDAFVDRPPLVYSNRTAWYPRPPSEDFATARVGIETPAGWLGVTGGELVSLRTEGGRTRAEYRLEQPGKFVTAIVGRLTDVGLRQEGEQAVRGFAGAAHARRDPRPDARRPGDAGLLRREVRPVALPDPRPRGGGGRDSRRPQPARARLPAGAPAGPARARRSPTTPRTSATCPASSSPTRRLTSGGARARPRRTTASAGSPRPGRSTRPRCGCASGSGEGAFRGMMDRMARWATPLRLRRPHPPRPAPRAPRAGRARLPGGRLRQGRLGPPHAARDRGRRGLLRRRARLPRALPLREGGHRGPARGARGGERARPAPLLRAVDLRDRPPGAPLVLAHGEGRRRLPHDDRRPAAGACRAPCRCSWRRRPPAGREARTVVARARGRLLDDRDRPGAAARGAERRPRAARAGRAGRPRAGAASA